MNVDIFILLNIQSDQLVLPEVKTNVTNFIQERADNINHLGDLFPQQQKPMRGQNFSQLVNILKEKVLRKPL